MTGLGASLDEYLRVRRSVGYKLVLPGWLLSDFVTFCETEHAVSITPELALRWATLPSQASSGCISSAAANMRCAALKSRIIPKIRAFTAYQCACNSRDALLGIE